MLKILVTLVVLVVLLLPTNVNTEILIGDANGDGGVNVGDARYILAYVYDDGPPPIAVESVLSDRIDSLGVAIELLTDLMGRSMVIDQLFYKTIDTALFTWAVDSASGCVYLIAKDTGGVGGGP